MIEAEIYEEPRVVTELEECFFYHTADLPGHGRVQGLWDLRGREREYLGGVDLGGKRVLEVGTASGSLCFYMERQGAEVVAYDLSDEWDWDIVPLATADLDRIRDERRRLIRSINNSYWFSHRAYGSKARVVYGSVASIPAAIGPVDVATFGCILLHVRDPFLAIHNALRLTRETVIITEMAPDWLLSLSRVVNPRLIGTRSALRQLIFKGANSLSRRDLLFLPSPDSERYDTWWNFTPQAIRKFLAVLGFRQTALTFHFQRYKEREVLLYTMVGSRTVPLSKT